MQPDVLKELESKGVIIHRFTPDQLKTLEKTWREVADELATKDPAFKEAYSSLRAWTVKYDRWRKLGYLDR